MAKPTIPLGDDEAVAAARRYSLQQIVGNSPAIIRTAMSSCSRAVAAG